MDSRSTILAAIKASQPPQQKLPLVESIDAIHFDDNIAMFVRITESIGSKVVEVNNYEDILKYLQQFLSTDKKFVTTINALTGIEQLDRSALPHTLNDIDMAIIPALFGVAENGAVWVTENEMGIRALPFICEQLAVVLKRENILGNLHQAYDAIGMNEYTFGLFIAGPSKTADIEQSLVLGAHGPKTMTIFLMN